MANRLVTFKKLKKVWWVSNITSLVLLIILLLLWANIHHRTYYSSNRISKLTQLTEKVDNYIKDNPLPKEEKQYLHVPTGIFIQSFEFVKTNTVQISGYVWQKVDKKLLALGYKPGVSFPDAISISNLTKAYEYDDGDYHLIGWHFFGVSLLQKFDYSDYPFDVQPIQIHLWPTDFYHYVILEPDLKSYLTTAPGHVFGLEEDIVKQGFNIEESYFDLIVQHYETTFGDPIRFLAKNSLELYFNMIVKRDLLNAFLIHFLPIFGIWCVLFAITMIISNDKTFAQRVGLSTTQIYGALAGIIFSVILMNNNLRVNYLDQPVLFMEYFYLITFLIIILVSYNAYIITSKKTVHKVLQHNLLPKTLFWPFILCCLIIITVIKFYVFS